MDQKNKIKGTRINKYMSEQGMATRREADTLIEKKIVYVNGAVATIGMPVYPGDKVEIRRLVPAKYRYVAYYKPRGSVSHSAQYGEKDIAKEFADMGLYPVGRLDKESEGLMILTNDGRIVERLLHPSRSHEKEYFVVTQEKIRAGIPAILARGMHTDTYGDLLPAHAKLLDENSMSIILQEGKKHQIRIMLAELHITVKKLKRTRIMNIKLGTLREGAARDIVGAELSIFLTSLGIEK